MSALAPRVVLVVIALLALARGARSASGTCICSTVQWVEGNGTTVPKYAVLVDDDLPGTSGGPVYVGRASFGAALLPGKYVADEGVVKATVAGKEMQFKDFEVLTVSSTVRWSNGNVTSWPHGAIEGGHEGCGPMYICKGEYFRYFVPGKLNPSLRTCSISVLGSEVVLTKFDILIKP